MCNRYQPASPEEILEYFEATPPANVYRPGIGPWQSGPFIRPQDGRPETVVGQWALIGDDQKQRRLPGGFMTNNCRSESVATKKTFRGAWARGQRCLVPTRSFDEPNYSVTGANIWWRFRRADRAPWALAGIWNEWTDPETGEVVPNFTILTMCADTHPLMSLMHKPEPNRPLDKQDKRTVISLERLDWPTWLNGTPEEAWQLLRLPAVELFDHGPAALQ